MINPKSQTPNPKPQTPNPKSQIQTLDTSHVLSRVISNDRADDQPKLVGLLDKAVIEGSRKPVARSTRSRSLASLISRRQIRSFARKSLALDPSSASSAFDAA